MAPVATFGIRTACQNIGWGCPFILLPFRIESSLRVWEGEIPPRAKD